ncbi:MAG: DUF2723 domain-containing protein [Bacteroidales bacterium]|nr:DUF2723 domain-containing protein [Bacteroidales bacterium]
MNFAKWNNIFGWLVFAIATAVYALTLEPTVSFWDCGEWIATSYKLEVGHPPGAPVYLLVAHLFSFLSLGDVTRVAWAVNMLSAVASGATVMFLFWTITRLIRRFGKESRQGTLVTLVASAVGALVFCFTDSFWFSAVEAEVYALSSLFTAVLLWAMLRWEAEYATDRRRSVRWLLLAALLFGLSEGVHFLSMLVIPSAVMLVYYNTFRPRWWKLLLAFAAAFGALLVVFKVLIPGVFWLFAKCNILFVNNMGFSANGAMLLTAGILAAVCVAVLIVSLIMRFRRMELAVVAFMLFLLGLSPNVVTILSSQSQLPLNEGSPDNPVAFYSYFSRDQYLQPPLVYGQYYTAPVEDYGQKSPAYSLVYNVETNDTAVFFVTKTEALTFAERQNVGNTTVTPMYAVVDSGRNSGYVYNKDFCTFFPRMWKADAEQYYPTWSGSSGISVPYGDDVVYRPSFADNLRFFVTFQLGHSYLRYFMWNFCGKFNDSQGYGSIRNGAVTTGIPFVDRLANGTSNSEIPSTLRNEGRNEYYAIPLILGILGLLYHIKRDGRGATVVGLFFVVTSIGLVFYLNSAPYEPRERDYVYVTSFYVFAIWVGMGAAMLLSLAGKIRGRVGKVLQNVVALLLMMTPVLVAVQNYDDHNRAGRQMARDSAYNLLMSCQKNAILFTHGDNDTFPLWYLQEVEGIRTDVRIVNLSLLSTPWYIDQCRRWQNGNPPLQLSFDPRQYQGRKLQLTFVNTSGKKIMTLAEVIDYMTDDKKSVSYMDDLDYYILPTARVEMPVNREAFAAQTPGIAHKRMPESIYFLLGSSLNRSDIMHYDILLNNDWRHPVYYSQYALSAVPELEKYLQLEGLAYRLTPFGLDNAERSNSEQIAVNSDLMLDIVLDSFLWHDLHGVYLDETCRRFVGMWLDKIAQLSATLVERQKAAAATRLWDTVRRYVPEKMLRNELAISMYDAYWSAGDTLANGLVLCAIDQIATATDYYFSRPAGVRKYFDADLEHSSETLLYLAQLAKKHGQEQVFFHALDRLSPFQKRLVAIWDSRLQFYFASDDPLHYEDEIGESIDKLQALYDLLDGTRYLEERKKVSEKLKFHVGNYMNL